jgi:hypothetical protein
MKLLDHDSITVKEKYMPTQRTETEISNQAFPLELQASINNSRNFAVFFSTAYGILLLVFLFLALTNNGNQNTAGQAGFYGIISLLYLFGAVKLSKKEPPLSLGWSITIAIMTIFSAVSILGILIDIVLWRNVNKISKFKKQGPEAFISDKEWSEKHKATWSNKRQIITSVVGAVLLTGLIIGLLALGGASGTNGQAHTSPADLASQQVAQAKAQSKFPQSTNSQYVTVTDITADGDTVNYHDLVKGADTSSMSDDSLRSSLKPTICSNNDLRSLLKEGVNIGYIYTIYETNQVYSFTITNSDCPQ